MPASRDTRRLVTYVAVAVAEEIARRAKREGRTVSAQLGALIAEALGEWLPAAPDPEPPSPPAPPPSPPSAPLGSVTLGGWRTPLGPPLTFRR